MVQVKSTYGTAEAVQDIESAQTKPTNVKSQGSQLFMTMAIIAAALVVCSALIMTAQMQSKETMLYGLGSGEEQEGSNAIATTFATFDPEAEYVEETLGAEYFKEAFKEVLENEAYLKNVDEVKVAVDEAKAEHKILQQFAEGADASDFGAAP